LNILQFLKFPWIVLKFSSYNFTTQLIGEGKKVLYNRTVGTIEPD